MHFATVKTYENIHKQTGNIQICHCAYSPGRKAGGNYPDIAATEDNEAVLDLYLTAAVNEAEGELRRKIKDSNDINMTSSGNEIIIEFKTSYAWMKVSRT